MYCSNCGTQISDNTKFCPSCGTQQGVTASKNQTSYDKNELLENKSYYWKQPLGWILCTFSGFCILVYVYYFFFTPLPDADRLGIVLGFVSALLYFSVGNNFIKSEKYVRKSELRGDTLNWFILIGVPLFWYIFYVVLKSFS